MASNKLVKERVIPGQKGIYGHIYQLISEGNVSYWASKDILPEQENEHQS